MVTWEDEHLWTLVHDERSALAEDLTALTEEQWHHTSLCSRWDVESVVAHLSATAHMSQGRWIRSMIGARFRPEVHNERRLAEQRGRTPRETLENFRSVIEMSTAPSGHTAAYLGEVVVHAQDIRQPLGLARTPSIESLTPVAEFFASRNFAVKSRTTVAGLQLQALDGPFATGSGLVVTGTTLALVMTMAGRGVYVDQLDGPGVETLRSRNTSSRA